MARLTTKQRKRLPDRDFAIPERRAYPIQDIAHARNALARVSAYGTPEEKRRVHDAVRKRYPGLWKRHEEYRGNRVILRKFQTPEGREYRSAVVHHRGRVTDRVTRKESSDGRLG